MSYLDGVPFRTAMKPSAAFHIFCPLAPSHVCSSPSTRMSILLFSLALTALPQHDFSLERKVQYWLEAASQHQTSRHQLHTDAVPTAPPCWLLLVDPCEGKETAGSRVKEGTVRRSISLSQIRPKTSPGLLEPPSENGYKAVSPDPGKQRRSMILFNNMKNELEAARRKLAALVHPLNRHCRNNRSLKFGPAADQSPNWAMVLNDKCQGDALQCLPSPVALGTDHCTRAPQWCLHPSPLANTSFCLVLQSLSPYSCLPPARPLSSHKAKPDSAADLLSALSQEERDLIEPVIALGYPARKAILTLQKTGRQSLGQFLGYLRACDRLLKQGYEEGQVEEAMEMFQYSEKKAAEFLHLLAQFHDMGFQQNEIKEVLLLCGNQRDKALEELMMKRQ
uniref:Ubiquitin associated protein 1 like n=1 Tax=Coturnix japonica TaxID=93934 RepID=A0A8C2UCH0_COTJA